MNFDKGKDKNKDKNKDIISVYTVTPTTNDNVCIINPITLSIIIIISYGLIYLLNKKMRLNKNKYTIIK